MLEIKNLLVRLGDTQVEIPHLHVEKGDYVAIMGTTGAGKTVLIETIAGFHPVQRGEILIEGKKINGLPPNKRGIAVVYQDYMLFPHMTVRENIGYPLKMRGKYDEAKIKRYAELLEVEHLLDRYPRTLSGGEMQRVAIARALTMEPKVLLLDEPFSSLDIKTRERARRIVVDAIAQLGSTVIHITHDFETAWLMANKVGIMHNGRLMQFGEIEEIFSRPNLDFVADFVDTNILAGEVIGERDSLTAVKVGNVVIYTSDRARGKVHLSIRPESIIISSRKIVSSMRNELRGKIVRLERRGNVIRVFLDLGTFTLVSVLTPNAVHALSLSENSDVFVYFKASSVHIL